MRVISIRLFLFVLVPVVIAGCVEINTGFLGKKTKPPEPEIEQPVVVQKRFEIVTASRLNLRARASSKGKILTVLKRNESVEILSEKKRWIEVRSKAGHQGWVSSSYLTGFDSGTADTGKSAATTNDESKPAPQKAATIVAKEKEESSTTPVPPAVTTQNSEPPPAVTIPSKTDKDRVTTALSQSGAFTREEAIVLYNQHRQSFVDGDYNAFLASIHESAADELSQKGFVNMKDFFLEMMLDLADCEVLKFTHNDQVALMVVRSDLDNDASIILNSLIFMATEGKWKVKSFFTDTFPRQDPQVNKAAIEKKLATAPKFQLAAVTAKVKAEDTASPPPPVAEVPSVNGKADGELVINGEKTPLQYAYAYQKPGFSDPTKMNTVVILSNMELDDEALNSWSRRAELEEIGKLQCVELTINTDNRVISRRLRHHAFEAGLSGVSSQEVFEPQTIGEDIVAGKAYSKAEHDFFGVTYEYRASFRAQVKEPATPSESSTTDTSSWTITPPTKEDLTTVPRFMKDAVEPVFKTVDFQAVVDDIKIVSSRSTAIFGFNTPEVVLYMPRIGNSAYAVVQFDDPELVDSQGRIVPFELESGGYNDDTFSAEIRFIPKEGRELVEFANIRGSGRIKYPLKINTDVVKKDESTADITLDGPYVTYTYQNIHEMAFLFTNIGPIRAYDATGRRIKEHDGYNSTVSKAGVTRRTIAFRGDIAELQYDKAENWVDMEFTYGLPPIKPWPTSHAGRHSFRPAKLVDTPGGRVCVKLISVKQTEKNRQPVKKAEADKTTTKTVQSYKKTKEPKRPTSIQEMYNQSSLQVAVQLGREEEALRLITEGADINYMDKSGHNALHYAVGNGDDFIKVIQALIDSGADVNTPTKYTRTPLHLLGDNRKEFVKVAQALVKAGADINAKTSSDEFTPLLSLLFSEYNCANTKLAQLLIASGADVNARRESTGETPLAFARKHNCVEMQKILEKAGAKVFEKEVVVVKMEAAPLKDSNRPDMRQHHPEAVEKIPQDAGRFYNSVIKGDVEKVKYYLDLGFPVNAKRRNKPESALLFAVRGKHVNIAMMLIEAGADVSFIDRNNCNAVYHAADQCESSKLLQRLIKAGAEINLRSKGGFTPLMMARSSNCVTNEKTLVKAGAQE